MAARLEYEMKRRGASGPAFSTICAEGANGALPQAVPGTRKVKKGSSILFDWGARVGRYNSDLTRMFFVGSIPRKIEEIYWVVLVGQSNYWKYIICPFVLGSRNQSSVSNISIKSGSDLITHTTAVGNCIHSSP